MENRTGEHFVAASTLFIASIGAIGVSQETPVVFLPEAQQIQTILPPAVLPKRTRPMVEIDQPLGTRFEDPETPKPINRQERRQSKYGHPRRLTHPNRLHR